MSSSVRSLALRVHLIRPRYRSATFSLAAKRPPFCLLRRHFPPLSGEIDLEGKAVKVWYSIVGGDVLDAPRRRRRRANAVRPYRVATRLCDNYPFACSAKVLLTTLSKSAVLVSSPASVITVCRRLKLSSLITGSVFHASMAR